MTAVRVLRWIAVLPGALLAGGVARIVVGILQYLSMPYDASILSDFFGGCVLGAANVWAFVACGVLIAPAYENATGFVLAGMFVLVAAFSAGLIVAGVPTSVQLSDPATLGEIIASIGTAGSLMVMAWQGGLPDEIR